jgi:hypothetical protein
MTAFRKEAIGIFENISRKTFASSRWLTGLKNEWSGRKTRWEFRWSVIKFSALFVILRI